jgi:hypothetical protein
VGGFTFQLYFAIMDKETLGRIIEDHVMAIEASEFQAFCDRMLIRLYPDDYTPVRAGGSHGDMKNDGYCPKSRTFFAAHATRGESAARTKKKIESDLEGCLKKQQDVREFIYLTNDTRIGEAEAFVDGLRKKHPGITIDTWGPLRIAEKLKALPTSDIGGILLLTLAPTYDDISANPERDYGIIAEIIEHVFCSFPLPSEPRQKEPDRLKAILDKIQLNFNSEHAGRVKSMFTNTFTSITVVGQFIEDQYAMDENRILALKEAIQSLYGTISGSPDTQAPIEKFSVFDDIALQLLPEGKRTDPEYMMNAKAIVLYFFEMCDIGKKTGFEPRQERDLFSDL